MDDDLDLILAAGVEAGDIAMRHFRRDPEVWYKNNGTSPVSAADVAVDTYLKDVLLSARPEFGWLSEETFDAADRLTHDSVFVVDPIDGTRAFIQGDETWCVSIAVVRAGVPVAGVLVAPALGETFAAGTSGSATKNGVALPIGLLAPQETLRFAAPTALIDGVADAVGRPVQRMPHVPSLAYRLAMIADGRLDATLVKPRARDWDIAAADLILRRVGGGVTTLGGEEIVYNRQQTDHGILVAGIGELMPGLARTVERLQERATG
ncbi:3'(2'),5'-bisphosphate nucleotidase CysQ [Pararhizobium haloflavum]|uniref:3'(2'),5'-bisphosphate nucleotidase CysQ n=1 Tax=Pararhizobium haloflavum TaxID=2037914 RepID=UPI001FE0C036|nr:3'(2'),5'-bisphosphate nucleotidase CysQ [Pararhizobium haloflavum]